MAPKFCQLIFRAPQKLSAGRVRPITLLNEGGRLGTLRRFQVASGRFLARTRPCVTSVTVPVGPSAATTAMNRLELWKAAP